MSILGLMSTEQLKASYSLNARRRVFYQYPNGAAPLMGLLSLMDTEETDKSEFGWHEDRFEEFATLTAKNTGNGCIDDDGGGDAGSPYALVAGTIVQVQLDDTSELSVRDVLEIRNFPLASGTVNVQGVVTSIVSATEVKLELITTGVSVLNTAAALDLDVIMIGSAAAEGDRSGTGFYKFPIQPSNFTQIFRHAFSFTRTALKAGLTFDSSGVYKTKAKKNSLKHMKALEYAAFFGTRQTKAVTNDDGEDSIRRMTGGIRWFLQQYELGNVSNGGAFEYRPNGSDISASDWRTTDAKRIINVNGTVTKDEFENLNERMFRFTNDEQDEKICLCGSGFLSAFNKFADRESLRTVKLDAKDDSYGMNVTMWESPHGTIYFKSHPLFTQTTVFRNSGFILDVGNLSYKPLNDSDTTLLRNRQAPDYDGRKDEWLTEFGLEVALPESHMFIENLSGIVS